MKYEAAYVDWVNAVNDATEVCTIGHALWVHNLGLYQAHYDAMENTIGDLKALCNASNPEEEFDISEAVAEAKSSYFKPSSGPHKGRKLVWWQQLCEPSISDGGAVVAALVTLPQRVEPVGAMSRTISRRSLISTMPPVKAHNQFEVVFRAHVHRRRARFHLPIKCRRGRRPG